MLFARWGLDTMGVFAEGRNFYLSESDISKNDRDRNDQKHHSRECSKIYPKNIIYH